MELANQSLQTARCEPKAQYCSKDSHNTLLEAGAINAPAFTFD